MDSAEKCVCSIYGIMHRELFIWPCIPERSIKAAHGENIHSHSFIYNAQLLYYFLAAAMLLYLFK